MNSDAFPDVASTSGSGDQASPPRRRAVPPMMNDVISQMNREVAIKEARDPKQVEAAKAAATAALPPEIADAIAKHPRVGPYIVHYGIWRGGIGAIAATYAYGFFGMFKKDQMMWANSFKYRVWILGPMIAAYTSAHGLLPMPFQSSFESWLGRPAVTMSHLLAADELKKQRDLEQRVQAQDRY